MALSTQPYKGTRDFYPDEMSVRRQVFDRFREIAHSFAFREYDGPLLESFDLYAAKSGEEIVNQQLYSFVDRGDRKVAIRPEMTPTLARMVAAKLGELQPPLKWFSIPNLYRYERPQKGRLREHWQLNVDILGGDATLADIEILEFIAGVFDSFGCADKLRIRVNHRAWVNYYLKEVLGLEASAALRCSKILDAKEKLEPAEFEKSVAELGLSGEKRKLFDEYLSESAEEMEKKHPNSPISELGKVLRRLSRPELYTYDPIIMRGLDYYTGIVFEGFDRSPSNRRAIFGGGRYDNLIALFGKQELSGVGFGMGDVVLMDFLSDNGLLPEKKDKCDFFVSLPNEDFWSEAAKFSAVLRKKNFSVQTSLKIGNFKKQLQAADRSGASYALLFGDDEWKNRKVIVRNMKNSSQEVLSLEEISQKTFS
jgi:histidyl-tRNA synthetase